jgi:alpha-L-fucosidase 2
LGESLRVEALRQRMLSAVTVVLILLAASALGAEAGASESDLTLAYDKPATKWTEALPVGNGRMGAMVFGGTEDERLQINESTLWVAVRTTIRIPRHTPILKKFGS